jgi:hypothetical protein
MVLAPTGHDGAILHSLRASDISHFSPARPWSISGTTLRLTSALTVTVMTSARRFGVRDSAGYAVDLDRSKLEPSGQVRVHPVAAVHLGSKATRIPIACSSGIFTPQCLRNHGDDLQRLDRITHVCYSTALEVLWSYTWSFCKKLSDLLNTSIQSLVFCSSFVNVRGAP